jgi:ABC transporter, permease protein
MLRLALYLAYIYYRKLFPKGDLLTMGLLLGVLCYALLGLYQHYETWHYALWSLPLSTFAYHNTRKDISLLKAHSHYRAILISEYVIESLPFFILMLLKNDFSTAIGILLFFVFISYLPQKNFTLKYPFSLTDPSWHIAFRKYKLIIALPLTIALVIIGRIYENPNVALFALGAMAFTACVPYFEREFSPHIAVANHKGEIYLREQLKAGLLNTMILFAPLIITYFIGFGTQNIAILPLFVAFPILGVITKYTFLENPLWQFFALAAISAGAIYIIPLIAIPYFYYLAIQKIKKLQYAGDSHSRKTLFR